MKTYFVTGTGTGVGKTFITAAIIRQMQNKGLRAKVLKPIISGFDPDDPAESDTAQLLEALNTDTTPEAIEAVSPWRFKAPLSPDMAARREEREISLKDVVSVCRQASIGQEDALLIEGVGGVMVPLNQDHTVLDWIIHCQPSVIIVAGTYLGTISHTLTTYHALATARQHVAGIVLSMSTENPVPPEETAETISRFIQGVPIICVPRQDDATFNDPDLTALIDI